MTDHPRIDELRRRIGSDPASIAFAQLGEEYRRSGNFQEAVRMCRAGLEQPPTYLSARVTLGRALLELEQFDEARGEFEYVLISAPDNLIALRSMAELRQRLGAEGYPEAARGDRGEMGDVGDAPISHAASEQRSDPVVGPPTDPVLDNLESWLGAILDDRASRAAS
ncbi:MAG: tetratricopeptide repeat protein [Acidobacteria bacterium]|nr:tetratricopeptide repeat protein [Acidobacteriota bacterium]